MKTNRIIDFDIWRGATVFSMIIFHFFFALNYLKILFINFSSTPWVVFGFLIRVSFLVLVGVSLELSFSNSSSQWSFLKKQLKRLGVIAAAALFVSFSTWLYIPDEFIRFGILHMIALGGLLLLPLVGNKRRVVLLLICSIFLPFFIGSIESNSWGGIVLGSKMEGFRSIDWFPIFPWLAWICFGVLVSGPLKIILKNHPLVSRETRGVQFFKKLGQNALLVYLVHVPIIMILLVGVMALESLV
ncbi:MAG: heparan-alpha-glucosaminide N-acetyltransferase domain-containing protein [Candidatus Gracilibacteria bacterium]|nr:heparan-alpha-glucosaminide N-acetyltransferase domain-containing protein [Candidatus Gracilibacteria bacterium]